MVAMVDLVLDTDPLDTMASVKLKLSPSLMLIPTTMVDMVDMDMVAAMVDLVLDTDPLDTMASVRLRLSPSLKLIPTTMVDMVDMDMVVAMVDMVDMVLDTGAMDSMVV